MLKKTVFKLDSWDGISRIVHPEEYFRFLFAAVKEPKDGIITPISGYFTCREDQMASMRSNIISIKQTQPTDKTRMLFAWTLSEREKAQNLKLTYEWLERAIKVLHVFDKLAGWPLTRVYKVETDNEFIRSYYFHSSRRWMKASYMISLYIMLIRMCQDKRITDFKNFDGLIILLDEIMDAQNNSSDLDQNIALKSDHHYVKDSFKFWKTLMLGYPKLFRKRKLEYYWGTNRINGSSGYSEGVNYLVTGDTAYSEVYSELLKVHENLKKKE